MRLLSLVVSLSLVPAAHPAPAPAATPSAVSAEAIDRYVEEYREHTGLPGAVVAVTQGPEVVRVSGHGHDSSGAELTPATPMPIASLSKSFTALAVVRLASAGLVDLDAPVRDYLDFRVADPRGERITVRHLLNQTSGMSDAVFPDLRLPQARTLAEAVTRLDSAGLADDPGTRFHYHNPNYQVLARLVEVVTGEPFAQHLRRTLFEPEGMADTTAVERTEDAPAHGYVRAFGVPVAVDGEGWFVAGSHGVVSTGADMARWLLVQDRGGPAVEQTRTPSAVSAYGMGWWTAPGRDHHNGMLSTYTADQILLPDSRYGIVVLTPTGMALENEADVLAQGLAELVRGGAPTVAQPAGVVADRVLIGLVLATVGLAALGFARSGRRRAWWRSLWLLLPGVLLFFLADIMGVVFGGRAGTLVTVAHVWPALVLWVVLSTALGLGLFTVRVVRTARR